MNYLSSKVIGQRESTYSNSRCVLSTLDCSLPDLDLGCYNSNILFGLQIIVCSFFILLLDILLKAENSLSVFYSVSRLQLGDGWTDTGFGIFFWLTTVLRVLYFDTSTEGN